ncbi:putative siderophore-binding lipoprotein YfiY [Corynebacterium provencense]|uniref:Putative siderophore-binding lipoprotein YfiY n=1 Tax=Corynebacterium provencense TaxID=1737425 RepID=A0A2Z3YNI8_9CORY|nr:MULTISPECIES: iron-siderophore ABC transporter substrate-binding protein [Corynebacterium]AWT25349.1 putative siderophore-binding lipoprotein YfiY [Corynebacterium provencense]
MTEPIFNRRPARPAADHAPATAGTGASLWSHLRRATGVLTATVLAAGLVACGTDGDGDATSAAGADFEPVTVTHALGTAEITEKPERVVTLGQGSAETAVALGVIPVGTEEYEWGADDSGQLPWIREELEKKQVPEDEWPRLIDAGDSGVSPEEVAALDPDVILAPWSGITEEQYAALSALAPTVAYPEKPWTIDWKDQITTVATALGEKEKAAGLIDGIEGRFAEVRSAHPEFAQHDFAFIYNQGPAGELGVFLPSEQRAAMVENLGLRVAPVVEQMKSREKEGTDSATFSLENADILDDVDVIFTFYSDPANRAEMEDVPTYGAVPAIRKGAVVAPTDNSFVTASSIINPLTVPWSIDRYVPMIRDALSAAA